MNEGKAPSLWLVPGDPGFRVIQSHIDKFVFSYSGPRFTPHLTLLGGLEGEPADLAPIAEALAAQIAPFSLELGAAQWGNTFFQRLYFPVAGDQALQSARQAAAAAFDRPNDRWSPHVSLLYAEPDTAMRTSPLPAPAVPVTMASLHLVHTVGPAAKWRTIAKFNLTGAT